MQQGAYMSTVYELPSSEGTIVASLDGEITQEASDLPQLLQGSFALLTAYSIVQFKRKWMSLIFSFVLGLYHLQVGFIAVKNNLSARS